MTLTCVFVVGVAGFEPTASSSRTGIKGADRCRWVHRWTTGVVRVSTGAVVWGRWCGVRLRGEGMGRVLG